MLCRIRLAFKASEMLCFDVSIPMVATNQTRAMTRIFRGGVLLVDVVNSNYTFIKSYIKNKKLIKSCYL